MLDYYLFVTVIVFITFISLAVVAALMSDENRQTIQARVYLALAAPLWPITVLIAFGYGIVLVIKAFLPEKETT